ncbi:MAG: undecaprenyl/decaprenyl-phosphate alpha-N-acetylglucosaminyl 1-phosphate transferase [Erysipelotrichaceae bacterium]|nr:undecaprenyl/decaprenyl-phosphate alpha-N-acetylglucosaminyl 1-phosphate transferase [Erysipelotrichaceae bacterium]
MSLQICLSFVVTFVISFVLVPLVSKVTKQLGIIAHTNNRTVHKGEIPRTGGYAVYASFLIGTMIFLSTDTQINAILIGGFIIFLTGFYDDIHDISPRLKMLGQIIAALVVVFYGGIVLKGFSLPFLPDIISQAIAIIITIGWIVGITNAINLIDGLDGLCAGISIIVLVTISLISLTYSRTDISSLSLLLAGAIGGFLVYNFHPASIFLGDCGALFIGFMISVISLLGFGYKSSVFFTLGAPIVVLMIPIMDTLIAIIRRRVHHKSFSEADRSHLHHKLMFSLELGQTKSVLILYGATILFSLCSYMYTYDTMAATILFLILMLLFEVFVEITDMIDRKYMPVLTIMNIFIKSDDLPHIKDTKPYREFAKRFRMRYVVGIIVILVGALVLTAIDNQQEEEAKRETIEVLYVQEDDETELMSDIYNQLESTVQRGDNESERQLVAAYFVSDYFTLSNKEEDEIGGIDYFYQDKLDDFTSYAINDYYENVNSMIESGDTLCEVVRYDLISNTLSNKALSGLEDYTYYDVTIKITFDEENPILNTIEYTTIVTLISKDDIYSVVAVDEAAVEDIEEDINEVTETDDQNNTDEVTEIKE